MFYKYWAVVVAESQSWQKEKSIYFASGHIVLLSRFDLNGCKAIICQHKIISLNSAKKSREWDWSFNLLK